MKELSNKTKGKPHQRAAVRSSNEVAYPSTDSMIKIPNPLPVQIQSSTEDHQRYASEKSDRGTTIRAAESLNRISKVGGIVGILGLLAVFINTWQSRSTFQIGQRAWVLSEALTLPIGLQNQKVSPIQFAIKNTGLSPALKFTSKTTIEVSGTGCGTVPMVQSPYNSYSVLGPNQTQHYPNLGVILTESCVAALNSGTAKMFVISVLRYEDIFGHSHRTGVCGQYEGLTSRNLTDCDNPANIYAN